MFEVGFTEIVLILGLALIVLGPEKLPGLAQKIGRWTGRARAMARQLHSQLEHEVTLEELAKSKPMQAPKQDHAGTAADEPPPATGFDLDQHFEEYETTPEKMHGVSRDTPPANETGTPESEAAATTTDDTPAVAATASEATIGESKSNP